MPPIELFVAQLCPYAHRVRLALAEKGLQATEIEIDLRNKPAWFLKLTPTGKVPLLRHQGQYVRESAIICEYLDDAFPERPIFPRDAQARAEARIWISFADTQLYARTATMMHSSDAMVHKRIKAQLADDLRFVEQHAFALRGADERFCWARNSAPPTSPSIPGSNSCACLRNIWASSCRPNASACCGGRKRLPPGRRCGPAQGRPASTWNPMARFSRPETSGQTEKNSSQWCCKVSHLLLAAGASL